MFNGVRTMSGTISTSPAAGGTGSTGAAPGGGGSGGTSVGGSTIGTTLPVLPPQYATGNLGFFTRQTESVPTSVTLGPDGAIYVGALTGIPYPDGYARVIRVDGTTTTTGFDGKTPSGVPQVFASGFSQIQSLGFDNQGDMYVLEYVNANTVYDPTVKPASLPPSLLIKVAPNGVRTTVSGPELKLGNYLLVDKATGDVFVATNNASADKGEVLRYHTDLKTGVTTNKVVASNLANPRGMSFGPDGKLYVLETGDGTPSSAPGASTAPTIPFIPGLVSERGGYTGSITRVDITSTAGGQQRILTGLPSFREFNPSTNQDRVISEGPNGLTIAPDGTAYIASGGGLAPETAVAIGKLGNNLQGVLRVDGLFGTDPSKATVAPAFNSLTYAAKNGPDGATTLFNTESNLNDVTVGPNGKIYAVDAARNDLYQLSSDGKTVESVTVMQKQPPVLTPPQYAAVVAAGGNPTAQYAAEITSTTTKNANSLPNVPGQVSVTAPSATGAPSSPSTPVLPMTANPASSGGSGSAMPASATGAPGPSASVVPVSATSMIAPGASAMPMTTPPPITATSSGTKGPVPHGEDAGASALPTIPVAPPGGSALPGPVDPVSPPVLATNIYAPTFDPFFGNFAPAASDPLAIPAGANGSYTVSNLYSFGDRLADNGTYDGIFKAGGMAAPATTAPYSPTGSFSDGPKWTTDLAQILGVKQTPGVINNFAYEDATAHPTGNPLDPLNGLLDFQTQVDLFKATDHSFKATDLVTVTFGGNDLTPATPTFNDQTIKLTVDSIIGGMKQLATLGAKHFLVTNSPDVTLAPLFHDPGFLKATGATAAIYQTRVDQFNTQLAAGIKTFQAQTGTDVKTLDLHALFNGIVKNPSAYGFTNVTQPVLTSTPGIGTTPVYNPAVVGHDPAVQHGSLFLDPYFDPTALGQAIVAQTARSVLA